MAAAASLMAYQRMVASSGWRKRGIKTWRQKYDVESLGEKISIIEKKVKIMASWRLSK